jgi:type VI protein secretion system component Hcp
VLQPSQKARERAAKQNKVTVLVLGTADVAFNTSVCCCYASQWKSKLLAPLSRGMTLTKMTLTWQQKQQQGGRLNYVQLKLLKPE